jgi:hypothetical protein
MKGIINTLSNKFIENNFGGTISTKVLGVYRIILGLLSFFYAYSYIEALPLIWFDDLENLSHYNMMAYVWCIVGLLILIGFYSRIFLLINFFLTWYLVIGQNTMYTVEEMFYQQLALWSVFINLDHHYGITWYLKKKRGEDIKAYINSGAIYFIGLVMSMYLFSSGYNKFIDPLWRNGYGFYHTLLLPWIKPKNFNTLLDYEWLMLFLNYLAIGFQLFSLPLYLFKKTRWIASVMNFTFTILLTFMFTGLSFLGAFGMLLLILPVLADSFLQKLFWRKNEVPIRRFSGQWKKYLVIFVSVICFFQFVFSVLPFLLVKSYPKTFYPISIENEVQKEYPKWFDKYKVLYYGYGKPVFKLLNKLSKNTIRVQEFALFNIQHTIAIYEYKVMIKTAEGQTIEPLEVYTDDKVFSKDLSFFSGLWYETQMYHVSNFCHSLNTDQDISEYTLNRIKGILNYAKVRAEKESENPKEIILYSASLQTPNKYVGQYPEIHNQKWIPIYSFDVENEEYRFEEPPAKFNLEMEYEPGIKLILDI